MNNEILYYNEHYTEFEPQCPIVIPSYQHRDNTILNNLKSLSNNKIMLFIYDTDYELYKEHEDEQIEIIQIHEQWRSIQRKRHWIQTYLANNRPEIENYIMIDDDIKKAKLTSYKENGSVTSKYIPIINALGILEHLHKKYSNTISGGASISMGILNDVNLYTTQPIYQVYLINNKLIKDHPQCMFRDMQNVSEDNVVWYDCYNNNITHYSFSCLYFVFNNQTNKKYSSIASTPMNRMRNLINALRVMKSNCKFTHSSEWNCWSIRFTKSYEPLYPNAKEILDKNMPNWEDLTVDYSDNVFNKVFEEIDKLLDNGQDSEINDFLI